MFVAAGVAGNGFTTTVVVPAKLAQPNAVSVTLYVPAIAIVAPAIVGFCNGDEYAKGPVHA